MSSVSDDPARSIKEAVSLVGQGRLDVSWLVTHRLPFEEAPRAYEMYEGYLDNIVKVVIVGLQWVDRFIIPQAKTIVTRGNDRFVGSLGNFITGQLFADKLIVRFIAIETANDVIAIPPRIGASEII